MVKYFALKNKSKIKQMKLHLGIVAVGLSPTLDNIEPLHPNAAFHRVQWRPTSVDIECGPETKGYMSDPIIVIESAKTNIGSNVFHFGHETSLGRPHISVGISKIKFNDMSHHEKVT